jgi:hypothetical protein
MSSRRYGEGDLELRRSARGLRLEMAHVPALQFSDGENACGVFVCVQIVRGFSTTSSLPNHVCRSRTVRLLSRSAACVIRSTTSPGTINPMAGTACYSDSVRVRLVAAVVLLVAGLQALPAAAVERCSITERSDRSRPCAPTCATCTCCVQARAIPLTTCLTAPMSSVGVAAEPQTALAFAEPHDILHVPKISPTRSLSS